jgi:hypothetical protein
LNKILGKANLQNQLGPGDKFASKKSLQFQENRQNFSLLHPIHQFLENLVKKKDEEVILLNEYLTKEIGTSKCTN